uniref:PNPLA domain-containing protein n=2 Tax=Mesocestoides corti TaxID=53468 RepID=A0A5K3EPG1_MESCO
MATSNISGRYYRDRSSLHYNLSFAGCGFLGVYHVGVISCIRRFAPQLYLNRPVSGASSGAIAAAFLVCDVDLMSCTRYLMGLINKSREYRLGAFDPRFKITEYIQEGLERLLPSDAHILCSGRLFISITRQSSGENVVVSNFKDRNDLIRAILCSSFIPVFGGFIAPTYQGDYFIDGAMSDNLPGLDKNTITVSPFCGDADICPRDDIWDPSEQATVAGHIFLSQTSIILNWMNFKRAINIVVPMSSSDLARLASTGYDDALRFLLTRGFISCFIHRKPRAFNGALHSPSSSALTDLHRKGKRSLSRQNVDSVVSEQPASLPIPTIVKSPSRNLLCELTNPLEANFYKTSFGSRSLAVPGCAACRGAVLNSYVSNLPLALYTIISGFDENAAKTECVSDESKNKLWSWWLFSRSLTLMPQWLSPTSAIHLVLSQALKLLVASTTLQLSAVRSLIFLCSSLIRRFPTTSNVSVELVTKLNSFDDMLTGLLEKGTAHTEKLADLLCSNESLDRTFSYLSQTIRSDLLTAVPMLSPTVAQSPLLRQTRSLLCFQQFAFFSDSEVFENQF